jgi:hypothetical protein
LFAAFDRECVEGGRLTAAGPSRSRFAKNAQGIVGDGELRTIAFCLFGVALLLGVGGCAGMSPSDKTNFQAVVAKSVSPGMPFVTGIKHLVKAGFTCDDRGSAPAVTCTRMRQNILPYACIQRVDLKTDPDRKTIVEVTPEPIACAGL